MNTFNVRAVFSKERIVGALKMVATRVNYLMCVLWMIVHIQCSSGGSVKFTTAFESSYKPLTEIQIQSWINTPPQKNITWYFEKYLGSDRYEEPEVMENFSINNKSLEFMTSTVSLKLTTTGRIICKACFHDICSSQNHIIVVADDKLKTTTSRDVALEGSYVKTCSASLYYYYSNITWQNENGQVINETDGIKISLHHQDLFTYKSVMEIRSVKTSDDVSYKCVAVAKNGTTIWNGEKLSRKARDIPASVVLPMSNTTAYYDEDEVRGTNISLICNVTGGSSKPGIRWVKNEKSIFDGNTTKYELFNENRELRIIHPDELSSGNYACEVRTNDDHLEIAEQGIVIKKNNDVIIAAPSALLCVLLVLIGFAIYCCVVKRKTRDSAHSGEGIDNLLFARDDNETQRPSGYFDKWEFPRKNLIIQEELGSGQFGVMMKAKAKGICEKDTVTTVAVKMPKRADCPQSLNDIAREFKVLRDIGRHLNIVNLLGACTNNIFRGEMLIIVEYCRYGSLLTFLQNNKHNFVNQIVPAVGRNESAERRGEDFTTTPTQDLFAWGFQVALAMEYLSQKQVVHGDLAARNVLLTDNKVVKICGIGYSEHFLHYGNAQKTTNFPVPFKWMAIEAIRDRKLSVKSDVWSFGVFLWEIFTLGCAPWPEFTWQEVHRMQTEGYRMDKTGLMSNAIHTVMLQCWMSDPTLRPTFSALQEAIGNMLPKEVAMYFVELNSPNGDDETRESSLVTKKENYFNHHERHSSVRQYNTI